VGVGWNCSCVESPCLFKTGMDGVPVFGWLLDRGHLVSARVIAGGDVLCFDRPVRSFQQSKLIISSCSLSLSGAKSVGAFNLLDPLRSVLPETVYVCVCLREEGQGCTMTHLANSSFNAALCIVRLFLIMALASERERGRERT